MLQLADIGWMLTHCKMAKMRAENFGRCPRVLDHDELKSVRIKLGYVRNMPKSILNIQLAQFKSYIYSQFAGTALRAEKHA